METLLQRRRWDAKDSGLGSVTVPLQDTCVVDSASV